MQEVDLFDLLPKDFTGEDCCGKQYWKWEDRAKEWLLANGYSLVRDFWSTDADSFGPLVRCIRLKKGDQILNAYYG